LHLSSDASAQNCSGLSNVAETLSSTGAKQQTWLYSRLNAVAYNATAGLKLTLGAVDTPSLPGAAQAAVFAASSAPLVLRLVNASIGSAGEPNVVVFSNDDDASGWHTALVLSTNKDAQKAAYVWNVFNSELGDRAWTGAVYFVGQTGCELDALGVSPAYITPPTLADVAGFWFVQLVDSVFSMTPPAAAAYSCAAMNFTVVSGHTHYLSGRCPSNACTRIASSYFSPAFCAVYQVYQNSSLGIGNLEPTLSHYTNASFYGTHAAPTTASRPHNISLFSIVDAAAAGVTTSGEVRAFRSHTTCAPLYASASITPHHMNRPVCSRLAASERRPPVSQHGTAPKTKP